VTAAPTEPAVATGRRRLVLATTAAALGIVDWAVKQVAVRTLADGTGPDLGVLQLRLVHNPGVAFGFGDTLPTWLIATLTGLVTFTIAVYAWRNAPTTALLGRLGLAAILAGASGRAADGVVTDYLHTGWVATFNLADTLITCGAVPHRRRSVVRRRTPVRHPTRDRTRAVAVRPHPDAGGADRHRPDTRDRGRRVRALTGAQPGRAALTGYIGAGQLDIARIGLPGKPSAFRASNSLGVPPLRPEGAAGGCSRWSGR
jgi:signal peptidase II